MEPPVHVRDQVEAELQDVPTRLLDGSGWNLAVLLVVSDERHAVIAGVNGPKSGDLTEGWLALGARTAQEIGDLFSRIATE